MQVVRFTTSGTPEWGVLDGENVHALNARPAGAPTLAEIVDPTVRRAIAAEIERSALPTLSADSVSLLAPVPSPGKIVCAGLNYHDHAEEQDEEIPETPLLFTKAPTAVTDPDAPIVHPDDVEQVDYEVELAVVIGRTGATSPGRERPTTSPATPSSTT